ncbi:MAG: VCBS repeat-containing protein, partial [Acidobacteriota bacterium]
MPPVTDLSRRLGLRAPGRLIPALLFAALPVIACREPQGHPGGEPHRPAPVVPESAGSTDAEFDELLRRALEAPDPTRSLTHGAERIAWAERRVESSADLQGRLDATFALGKEQLRAGATEPAIESFRAARGLLDGADAPASFEIELRRWLAVSYLRLGEQDNCLALHGAGSCILPIVESARHVEQRGSRRAMVELLELLEAEQPPGDLWLLNLAAMTIGEYPDGIPERFQLDRPLLFGEPAEIPRFIDRAADVGLDVTGLSGGVVIEDFDLDGRQDVMVSSWGHADPLRIFLNSHDGSFIEVTDRA